MAVISIVSLSSCARVGYSGNEVAICNGFPSDLSSLVVSAGEQTLFDGLLSVDECIDTKFNHNFDGGIRLQFQQEGDAAQDFVVGYYPRNYGRRDTVIINDALIQEAAEARRNSGAQ